MAYFVCFQNCVEDYYSEDALSLKFPSFDAAIRYLTSLTEGSSIPAPKVDGGIRWYFPDCGHDGVLHDPDPDIDQIELNQIINIIPCNTDDIFIRESYTDDPDAIITMRRNYTLDFLGRVDNVELGEIQYICCDK